MLSSISSSKCGVILQDFQRAVKRACDMLLQLSVVVNIYKILLVLLQYVIISLLFTVIFLSFYMDKSDLHKEFKSFKLADKLVHLLKQYSLLLR